MTLFKLCLLSLAVILHVSSADDQPEHGEKNDDVCFNWIRHEPKKWPRKYSKYEVTIKGHKQKAWNQDLTDEFVPKVIETYMNDFTKMEPISRFGKCSESPSCVKDYRTMLNALIAKNLSLIALTKDNTGKKYLLGYRILIPHLMHGCSDSQSNGPESTKINKVVRYLYKQANFFEQLNVGEYLTSMGHYVLAPYSNENAGAKIGEQLIRDTVKIAICHKFKYAASIFTDTATQCAAKEAGWTPLKKIPYDSLPKDLKLADIDSESKFAEPMYARATRKSNDD